MKAQAALVGADGAIHLYSIATIDMHLALIIGPGYTKGNGAFRFEQAFQNALTEVRWIVLQKRPKTGQNFFRCLLELRLIRIFFSNAGKVGRERVGHGRGHLSVRV